MNAWRAWDPTLAENDRIAADGWLLQAEHLQEDESLLTGESVPVGKRAAPAIPPQATAPGGEDSPVVFAACHVVRGQGMALVSTLACVIGFTVPTPR